MCKKSKNLNILIIFFLIKNLTHNRLGGEGTMIFTISKIKLFI